MADSRNQESDGRSSTDRRNPATSLVTWGLALVFLALIDVAITRTSILWGPKAFEHSGGFRTVMPQTFQVLRKIYRPEGDFDERVVLLGNSRLALSIEAGGVEDAIAEMSPGRRTGVSNLAIFGAYIGDTAILARHLPALDPDLVVLTLGGSELGREVFNPQGAGPVSLLEIGWSDGPVPSSGVAHRLDRWLRTLWPLYRFREFVREAALDFVLQRPDPGPPPKSFATRRDLFVHLYGDRSDAVAAAHERFLADQTLENFTHFVETVNPGHLRRQIERVKTRVEITESSPPAVVLDQLLADLKAAHPRVMILLMPENPILALDTEGKFHRPDQLEEAARVSMSLAAKHGIKVVDGRRWLPIDVFLDFHHPLFEPEHFQRLLAKELIDALDS